MEQILPLEHASLTLITERPWKQHCTGAWRECWYPAGRRKAERDVTTKAGLQRAKLTEDW